MNELRREVQAIWDKRDEFIPLMTNEELEELIKTLEEIKRNRERGGHSLN